MNNRVEHFPADVIEQVEDAILRLKSACAIPYNAMTIGLENPQTFGFELHPLGALQLTVGASGPDVFVCMATNGTAYSDTPTFYRTEIPNDASGFTLATMAVDITFQLCLEGMLGSDDWPTVDTFLEAMKPEDGVLTVEEAWEGTDNVALTYLGQIDINPPALRKLILTPDRQALFDQYFDARPHSEFSESYRGYLRSADEAPLLDRGEE